jgi:DNA gyrase subunit A
MMGILEGRPVLLTLPVILHTYVKHRENVIEKRSQFELDKAEARAHVLEGLVKAQGRIDDIVAVGKASKSREQFELVLQGKEQVIKGIELFEFTEPQSKAIAERRLYQLSQLDVNKVQNEFEDLKIKINHLVEIITSRERRLEILVTELEEMVEKHGDQRRSYIDPMPLSMDREDLIEERAIAITLSEDNYIRHSPVENFRLQNRGGKGLKGVATKEEDTPKSIITCFSKDRLLIFTDQGRVYGLKAWETPVGSRHSKGSHIRNLLGSMREDEKIISIMAISKNLVENPQGNFLLFATHLGLIKKTKLEEYVKINKNGKYALRFKLEGDKLVNVRSGTNESDIVMISSTGFASRFACSAIRASGRVSAGVWGIRTGSRGSGGHVVGMVATNDTETQILTITKNGMAKRSRLGTSDKVQEIDKEGNPKRDSEGNLKMVTDGYRRTRPGAKGIYTMDVDISNGDEIVSIKHIPNVNDNLFLLTKKGMMIRIKASQTKESKGKKSKGTRIMELRTANKTGYIDSIIFAARLPAELIDSEEEE